MKQSFLFKGIVPICVLSLAGIAGAATGDPYISEMLIERPGADKPDEFIELRTATGNETIAADTYLVFLEGDDTSTSPGQVDGCFPLGGLETGSNGYLVFMQYSHAYSIDPDATVYTGNPTGFQNIPGFFSDMIVDQVIEPASCTAMIVRTSTPPTTSTDIDSDDDGVIDISGWTIIDSVGMLDDGTNDIAYGAINFRASAGGISSTGPFVTIPHPTNDEIGYIARIPGAAIDSVSPSDWVASITEAMTGSAPTWTLPVGHTEPSTFEGVVVSDHIGAANSSLPVELDMFLVE